MFPSTPNESRTQMSLYSERVANDNDNYNDDDKRMRHHVRPFRCTEDEEGPNSIQPRCDETGSNTLQLDMNVGSAATIGPYSKLMKTMVEHKRQRPATDEMAAQGGEVQAEKEDSLVGSIIHHSTIPIKDKTTILPNVTSTPTAWGSHVIAPNTLLMEGSSVTTVVSNMPTTLPPKSILHHKVSSQFPPPPPPPPPAVKDKPPAVIPRMSHIWSAQQIANSIPPDASAVFHILDRRINMDSITSGSMYSLVRAWVQDDPDRVIPPRGGVQFSDDVSLRSSSGREIPPAKTHRTPLSTICVIDSLVEVGDEESINIETIQKEHVERARKIRKEIHKQQQSKMNRIAKRMKEYF